MTTIKPQTQGDNSLSPLLEEEIKRPTPGYYNRIIPPEVYRESLSHTELSRNVLNCSLCENVSCKSSKFDIDVLKREVYFYVDEFFKPSKDDWITPFILESFNKKYPNTNRDSIFISPSFKTEGGSAINCSDYIIDEILINAPKRVYYFSDYIPLILNQQRFTNYGDIHYIGYTEVIPLPSLKLFKEDPDTYPLYHYL